MVNFEPSGDLQIAQSESIKHEDSFFEVYPDAVASLVVAVAALYRADALIRTAYRTRFVVMIIKIVASWIAPSLVVILVVSRTRYLAHSGVACEFRLEIIG